MNSSGPLLACVSSPDARSEAPRSTPGGALEPIRSATNRLPKVSRPCGLFGTCRSVGRPSADSPGMQDFEAPCQEDRADWVRLLAAYAQAEEIVAAAEAATKAANPSKGFGGKKKRGAAAAEEPAVPTTETPPVAVEPVANSESPAADSEKKEAEAEDSNVGWVSRIAQLEGVDPTRMSTLHGRVIALGYLKFQLIDRQIGLRYRLTPAGKQVVKAEPADKVAA